MTTLCCRRPPAGRALRRWLAAVLVLAAACDGGTGPSPKPDPQNPVPSISGLDPATLLQWSDSATVTVTGAGFVNGAVVRLNGAPRLTTYHGPSRLTAVVPAASLQQSGTLQLTVFNPAPGGGESGGAALPVHHRVPAVAEASPGGVMQGSDAFTLTLTGNGFAQGSVVRWNGEDRPTTWVSQSQLTAQIPAGDVAAAGTASVTVFTPAPGGGLSPARAFDVAVRPNPLPAATAISPGTIMAETGTSFTVTGTGFMAGTRVTVGGYVPVVTVVSATELRFTLAPENVPNAGFAPVLVSNPPPGGGASAPLSLRVDNPAPTLTALSPATGVRGADSVVVRLTGTGFVRGSVVQLSGTPNPGRRISPTEMEMVFQASQVAPLTSWFISVRNPSPGGGVTGTLRFDVHNPVPRVTSLSPANALAGQDSLVVRVTGSGFVEGSEVRLGGSARPTRRVGPTELEGVLTRADVARPGTLALTVFTPAPGGGTSQPADLVLTVPVPVLTSLPSSGASAGRRGFLLVVHGTGFVPSSEVRWNGQARTTNYISGTRLEANVSDADVAVPGTVAVTVHTPGGGTSAAQQMTIRAVPSAALTSTRAVPVAAVDIAYAPAHDRIYAAVPAGASARQNMVVAINPRTGEVTDSVLVGGNPDLLAVSDDGSTLWVSLWATGQVRRLSLPGLVPGTVFSLGSNRAEDMRVMPGSPGTLAIALQNTCCGPGHEGVAIYDDGVRRSLATPNHTGSNTITFGESAAVLYGQNTEHEYGFRTMRVNAAGVEEVRGTYVGHHGFRIQHAAGRVYTNGMPVLDAGRHAIVGSFPGGEGFDMVADAVLGRAYFRTYDAELRVYDLNSFQLIGSTSMGSTAQFANDRRLLRWGTDGLAYNEDDAVYIVRTPIAGP